jgi:MFS family permease
MMPSVGEVDDSRPNHPLAIRMAIIGFIANNLVIGTIFGSFSVLVTAVESRLGIDRAQSTLAISVVTLAMTLCAPAVGVLATRFPLRLLMLIGAVLSTLGFALLSVTGTYWAFLACYGLLLGPGMAFGVILPPTLVTRWFSSGRGRALGLISMPVLVGAVPLAATWWLQALGLPATYAILAAISAIAIVTSLFVVDNPPDETGAARASDTPAAAPRATRSVGGLLRSPRFWALAIAAAATSTASVILSSQMVPMAKTWGYSPTTAAVLLTVQSLIGIAGTILFGWIGDRLGGVTALLLIVVDGAILWALLLLGPPLPVLIVLIAIVGMHGAGALPVLGLVLSQTFGKENFSEAYGLANLVNLPFSVVGVPVAALIFTRTGSYAGVIMAQIAFFAAAAMLVLWVRQRRQPAEAVTPR